MTRGLVFVLLAAFAGEASGQSLADLARRERERQSRERSTVTVTSIVPGAASITSAGTAATTPTMATPPSGPANARQSAEPLDNQGRDEKYWRAAFQKARDDARRAEERAQLLDLRVKDLNKQLFQNSLIYNREYRIGPEITAAQQELETARNQTAAARQRVLDLEEELRRAGGLPGWAR